jgi:hypothetical protein
MSHTVRTDHLEALGLPFKKHRDTIKLLSLIILFTPLSSLEECINTTCRRFYSHITLTTVKINKY